MENYLKYLTPMTKLISFQSLIVIVGLLLCTACTADKDPFKSLSEQERSVLSKEYYDKAVKYNRGSYIQQSFLDSSLMADPNYSESLFEKSIWFTQIGDLEKGHQLLAKAVSIDPEIHLGYYAWVQLYRYHDYVGAIESIEELSGIYPDVTQYPVSENQHLITANAYRQLKEYKEAIRYYNKCVVTDGKSGLEEVSPYIFVYRALCWHDLKEYERAIKDFDLVIGFNERCADAYFFKAKTLETLKKPIEALNNYQLAFKHKAYLRKGIYSLEFDPIYEADIIAAINRLKTNS